MPPKGALLRAEQLALMASLSHQEKTSTAYKNALEALIDLESGKVLTKDLSKTQKGALREWRHDYLKSAALPPSFVKEFAKLTAEAMPIWAEARKEKDFSLFAPYLEKIVSLNRKKADYLGYKKHPYNALLDLFEPEMTIDQIDPIFEKVKGEITKLLRFIEKKKAPDNGFLHGKFSHQKQRNFCTLLLDAMGYEREKGRLDLSTHPFSSSLHPFDSRITIRLTTPSLFDSISAAMHEGGHSLYEMGLPVEHYGTPLCEAVSYAIHESQSRLWETRVGQSKAFWKHYLPDLKKAFPKLSSITLPKFYRAINKVSASFIRVESDEVTYPLHVILRYELEKELIRGTLAVQDLPEAWNQKCADLIGITPRNDTEGCLQDIHWSMGAFGYFPTYLLGTLYASQMFTAFTEAHPDWEKRFAKGELLFLRDWLRAQVHEHGRAYTPGELIKRISGKPLSEKPHLSYLQHKYQGEIYR
ncbi:MAG: Thermostable carboxypeptidase 1 [Chlamydiae bacterium]|nr:Thermostable carboxypeptidase 1 [Chlamydiota bacterium]